MDFKQFLDIIQSIGIVATILFAVFSMRDTRRKAKADIIARIYSKTDFINSLNIQYPEFKSQLSGKFDPNNKPLPVDGYVDIVITHFQELFYHHRKYKQIEVEEWNAWIVTIKKSFHYPYIKDYWEFTRSEYNADFCKFIDEIIITLNEQVPLNKG